MVKTKGVERSVSNWKSGAAGATGRYAEGAAQTTGFTEAAVAGQSLYAQRVQESIAKNTRVTGLQKSGDTKWKEGISKKGVSRWAPGVNAAESDYRKGIAGVLSVIEGVALPPKTSDPAANVAARVTPIAVALRAAKDEGRL